MVETGQPVLEKEKEQLRKGLELDILSSQQEEIAALRLKGLSARQIADRLGLKPPNVRTQLRRVAQKVVRASSGEIHKKGPGAEPAPLSDLRQIPPERRWQYSPQQRTIIEASSTSASLYEISKVTGISYDVVRNQVRQIRSKLAKEAEMEKTIVLRVAIR